MTTTDSRPRNPTRPPLVLRTLFVLLLLAPVARLAVTVWEPPFEDGFAYDDLAAVGGAYWPAHLFVGGPAYGVAAKQPVRARAAGSGPRRTAPTRPR